MIARISVVEFGCGGGCGLVNAEMRFSEITKIFYAELCGKTGFCKRTDYVRWVK